MRLSTLVFLLIVSSQARAQTRYKFGDDPKWADPNFDDSAWPVAAPTKFPIPDYDGDGMVWLRYRVIVPRDASPLAVHLANEDASGIPLEVLVNGVRVSDPMVSRGQLPSISDVRTHYPTVVFDLPNGIVTPGELAVVACRLWVPPIFRTSNAFYFPPQPFEIEIGYRNLMRAKEQMAIAGTRLSFALELFTVGITFPLSVGLLVLCWFTNTGRVILWFSVFLLFNCMNWWAFLVLPLWRADWSYRLYWAVWSLSSIFLNVASIAFLDAAIEKVPRWMIRILFAIGIIWAILLFLPALATTPSPLFQFAAIAAIVLFGVFQVGWTGVALRAILRGPLEERMLAAAIAIWGIDVLLVDVLNVVPISFHWFGFRVDTDWLLFVPIIAAMSVILLRRMWKDWRANEELSAEFDAARAMQARLVPPAVDVPGYRIESAYYPARHVGGDFFRIMPAENGSVLVVVGDVSGKGLGAAMTVAALAGALDNEFSRSPGEVLEHLNRALLLRKGEGFVTCCAALLESSGEIRIANAGHLSPYARGAELSVEAALPLGVVDGVTYAETLLQVGEGEGLTFVSDGVVEAANSTGELFGFDRTREISTKSADEIAEAAKVWGQNDDITVVTVRRNA